MRVPDEWWDTLGAGVKVFVLDAGLVNADGHLRPVACRDFVGTGMATQAGHGDKVARLIASRDPLNTGVAPFCDLYVAKVYDAQTWNAYATAMAWAISEKAQVVNMSFGGPTPPAIIQEQIRELDQMGCICVGAYTSMPWPSQSPHVLKASPASDSPTPGVLRVVGGRERATGAFSGALKHPSYAAAVLSGICALAKASNPTINREELWRRFGPG